jgi:hypothetical protein
MSTPPEAQAVVVNWPLYCLLLLCHRECELKDEGEEEGKEDGEGDLGASHSESNISSALVCSCGRGSLKGSNTGLNNVGFFKQSSGYK